MRSGLSALIKTRKFLLYTLHVAIGEIGMGNCGRARGKHSDTFETLINKSVATEVKHWAENASRMCAPRRWNVDHESGKLAMWLQVQAWMLGVAGGRERARQPASQPAERERCTSESPNRAICMQCTGGGLCVHASPVICMIVATRSSAALLARCKAAHDSLFCMEIGATFAF